MFLFSTFFCFTCPLDAGLTDQSGIRAANQSDYFYEIPDYPASFSAENVIARLTESLGFRFYWVSESLTENDLVFRPSDSARSTAETIRHIYDLSEMITKSVMATSVSQRQRAPESIAEYREATLKNLMKASQFLRESKEGDIENMKIIITRSQSAPLDYPFWHSINGPISDAIYHTGQISSFRRSSGNPMNPNVSVFLGRVR